MTEALRPEIVPPSHTHVAEMVGVSLGCGVLGTVLALIATAAPAPDALVPAIEPLPAEESVRIPSTATAQLPAVPPPTPAAGEPDQLLFVFRVGGATYIKLADFPNPTAPLPKHGKLELVERDDVTATVGVVADVDVPVAHQAWRGRDVLVDQRCTAPVVGFAVVSRLVGDPASAGLDARSWTAASVMANGSTVLAARIDGCANGLYARDAALPRIIALEPIEQSADLVDAARSALLATDAAKAAQTRWSEAGQPGVWSEHTELETQVLRHPLTGATWISVHGKGGESCGDPDVNTWGLFRVGRDGSVETVEARHLGTLHSIERIIDIDGDGTPELVGRPWLGLDLMLTRASGVELEQLELPLHGCPC